MEAHKAKRLAARNEMINLAKVGTPFNLHHIHTYIMYIHTLHFYTLQSLERAHVDGDEIKSKVQFILVPMVYDQVGLSIHACMHACMHACLHI